MNTTFGIGSLLGTGFRIWIKNFIPFMVITALIHAPSLIWGISTVQGTIDLPQLYTIARFERFDVVLHFVLNIMLSAALIYGVVMQLQGERASLGACIRTGFARFFPVLGTAVLSALCILGGSILLVVPGIIFACMLYVATPAAVLERPGVVGALKRSRVLTAGHRFEIFVVGFIVLGLGYLAIKIIETATLEHLGDPSHFDDTLRSMPVYIYAKLGLQMVLGSLGAVMSGVAYSLLRAEKEGTTAEQLARIFD